MTKTKKKKYDKKTWEQFQDAGMLWFVNRLLHVFGWVIVIDVDILGTVTNTYPARCVYRGFPVDTEEKNFEKIQKYLVDNIEEIYEESGYEGGDA